MQTSPLMPVSLQASLTQFFQAIQVELTAEQQLSITSFTHNEERLTQLSSALAVSRYLQKICSERPALYCDLLTDDFLYKPYSAEQFLQELQSLLLSSEDAVEMGLRQYRQKQMARFIFCDINRLVSTQALIQELSWFADACIQLCVDWAYAELLEKHGEPIGGESQQVQSFVVLGMGKLGAYELNLSSDIDLIFCYPEAGQTNGKKSIDNQLFFTRLGQKVVKLLDRVTIDGFVFRVDMRLRPYGQSGALVLNFDAMELYYEEQGREWERYAMIKARCVAGDKTAGQSMLARLRPFVYRRYTDFSAIQSLREMKELINREVRRLGKQDDVKLGLGGIREIEFIAQSYQLIYGGRDESLQERSVLTILPYLGERGLLPKKAIEQLLEAYFFLRNVEHIIQAIDDEQTQRLPQDEERQIRLAYATGYPHWQDFLATLNAHKKIVHHYFTDVVADAKQEDTNDSTQWRNLWLESDVNYFAELLIEKHFTEREIKQLSDFKQQSTLLQLSQISSNRVNEFMPLLLQDLALELNRDEALFSLLRLVEAVLRRTSYLVLFIENPKAISRLIIVAKASQWVMDQLILHPVLLDELIATEGLGVVPPEQHLTELLQQQSLRLAIDDVEAHMEMLRYFKLSHHLHVIAAEASGNLPLMKVSDYLSFLADAILQYVLVLSWQQMVEKYGYPTRQGESLLQMEFAIIGYGKLGGIELSHSSDLDLVFIYDADEMGQTDGIKAVDNRTFYTRLGQRIIHILTTLTTLGRLYEVDMRLRPSGANGLLVSPIDAFEKYQQNDAWTWEHQALVRARPVAGAASLITHFQKVRKHTLNRQRDLQALRKEVIDMREKMADNLTPAQAKGEQATVFHLKHSRGGIVDIEFMVQFCVLAFAWKNSAISYYTDNIRILEALAKANILSVNDVQALIDIYRLYRAEGHRLALMQAKNEVPAQQFQQEQALVKQLWATVFALQY